MSPLVDFVVICCHSVHISEYKPLPDDSLLKTILSLLCSTIFHSKIVQINCCQGNVCHEGERLVHVFGLVKNKNKTKHVHQLFTFVINMSLATVNLHDFCLALSQDQRHVREDTAYFYAKIPTHFYLLVPRNNKQDLHQIII